MINYLLLSLFSRNKKTKIEPSNLPPPPPETKLIPFLKGDKYGFCDLSKNIVIAPQYSYPGKFVEDLALVWEGGEKFFIDRTGKKMFDRSFIFANPFSEGLALITIEGKQLFIDRFGREVFAFQSGLSGTGSFKRGLARVVQKPDTSYRAYFNDEAGNLKHFSHKDPRNDAPGKSGFINQAGRIAISCIYEVAKEFNSVYGLARVKRDEKWGFIDTTGSEIIVLQYDEVLDFTDGLALVKRRGKYGYIDPVGREVIAPQFDVAAVFSENLAWVGKAGKLGYIDTTGEQVIAPKYGAAGHFGNGLAAIWFDGKLQVIDRTGREVFAPQYNFISTFREGLAAVTVHGAHGLKGFIDTTGREVIVPKYKNAMQFEDGLAYVQLQDDKWIYLDKNGVEFYEP